jgi:hypothetical protein
LKILKPGKEKKKNEKETHPHQLTAGASPRKSHSKLFPMAYKSTSPSPHHPPSSPQAPSPPPPKTPASKSILTVDTHPFLLL